MKKGMLAATFAVATLAIPTEAVSKEHSYYSSPTEAIEDISRHDLLLAQNFNDLYDSNGGLVIGHSEQGTDTSINVGGGNVIITFSNERDAYGIGRPNSTTRQELSIGFGDNPSISYSYQLRF